MRINYSAFKAHILPTLSVCSFLFLGVAPLSAQQKAKEGMQSKEYNFSSFEKRIENHNPLWKVLNSETYYSHPEFGKLPYNTPCEECVEIYEKRTSESRYFVSTKDTSVFYIQQAMGQLHQKNGKFWQTIDHRIADVGNGQYIASLQTDPVGFDSHSEHSFIQTPSGKITFNNWSLFGVVNGDETLLATADWSNYTVGSDGIRVHSVFPGIDAEMAVMRGAVKTNFIIKEHIFNNYDKLIFSDEFSGGNGNLEFESFPGQSFANDRVLYKSNSTSILEIGKPILYPRNAAKSELIEVPYELNGNHLRIAVSDAWIEEKLAQYGELIIDPLVSSSNSLAQASITGSMYNSSCGFTNSCDYNLTVPTPANAQLTDVLWTFSYTAAGLCWMEDGAVRFATGSCVSPSQAGYYWFCNSIGTGTCDGVNISIFSDLQSCLPAPSCTPQNANFTMQFFRTCYGATGCNSSCIGAATPWTITIEGETIDYQSPTNPITLSNNTVCEGGSLTASTTAQYGVAPYTYEWSMDPSGTPSVGTGASTSINFTGSGSQTVYSIVTDACGNQVSNSASVVVNPSENADFQYTPSTICLSSPNPVPVITNGTSVSGTFTGTGVTFADPTTGEIDMAATGPGTYSISFTTNGPCPGTHSQSITITNAPDATFSYSGPFCAGGTNPVPQLVPGASSGQYTASSTDLSIDASTGEIDLQNSLPGTYTVTNDIAASGACPAANHSSPVTILPAPTATLSGGGTACQGDPLPDLTINLTGTGPWDIQLTDGSNTQTITINSSPYTYSPSGAGTYEILSVDDQNCSGTSSGIISVTVSPAPDVNPVSDITVCANGLVDVPDFSGSLPGTTFSWTNTNAAIGLGTSGNGNIADFTGTNTGNTPISGQIEVTPDVNGCQGTPETFLITINPAPAPSVTGTTSYCLGDNVTDLTATASAGGQLDWYDDPSLTTSIATGTTFTPSSAVGVHTYYVTEQFGGCTSSPVQITVTVNNLPVVDAGNDQTYCEGSDIILSGSGAVSYSWDNGVQDGQAFVQPPGSVTYTVTGTDANGCSNTDQVTIVVDANPEASFTASPSEGIAPLVVTFDNTSSGATDYNWDFGNGETSNSSDASLTSEYTDAGTYTVTLIVTNANGCSDVYNSSIEVALFAPLSYVIPNVFTPNGDGINDTYHFNLQNAASFDATIMNRWGNTVGRITDVNPQDGWTGKDQSSGQLCAEGVYFCQYVIIDMDGQEIKGNTYLHLVYKK